MSGSVRITLAGILATTLASLALIPAYTEAAWFWPAFLATAFVGVVGFGLRQLGTPKLLVPVGQLAALGWAFILLYARTDLRWGFLPTGKSVQTFFDKVEGGLQIVIKYAAPVPSDAKLVMVTALGIGLVAIVVDTVAATFRMVPWAGLPLLLLYSVPATTVRGGISPIAFIPAAIGYIVLLVSEGRERLSRWGRVIGFADEVAGPSEGIQTSLLGQTGRRVGAAVIGLAVVVPAVIPALPEGVFGTGPGDGSGGSQTILVGNPMVDLRRDLRMPDNVPVMTYTIKGTDQRPYIRLVTLDNFNGDTWSAGEKDKVTPVPNDGKLPFPDGLGTSAKVDRVQSTFKIAPSLKSAWLPTFASPQQIKVDGDWSYDPSNLDIVTRSDDQDSGGAEYEISSLVIAPTDAILQKAPPAPSSIREPNVRLADSIPDEVVDLANQVTKGADSDWERASMLQAWFRKEFSYSTEVNAGHGGSALMEFLKDKRGYCEQFSATMAIMARALGVPARVAVGYQAGTPTANDQYEVKVQDAHAWPEIYFAGYGWVPFEPTPGQRTGSAPAWTTHATRSATPAPTAVSTNNPDRDRTENNLPKDKSEQGLNTPVNNDSGGPRINPLPVAIGGGVLLLLALPAVLRVLVRRRRLSRNDPARLAESCWAELADTIRDLGHTWDDASTPRAVGTKLATRLPVDARDALTTLVAGVERSRYAPHPDTRTDLRAGTHTILRGLRRRSTTGRRLLAFLFPPSFWRPLLSIGRPITWVLDSAETAGAWLVQRLRPRRAGS